MREWEAKVKETRAGAVAAIEKANEAAKLSNWTQQSANAAAATFRSRRFELERILLDAEPEAARQFREWIEDELPKAARAQESVEWREWSALAGQHIDCASSNRASVVARMNALVEARREMETLSRQYLDAATLAKRLAAMKKAIPEVRPAEVPADAR